MNRYEAWGGLLSEQGVGCSLKPVLVILASAHSPSAHRANGALSVFSLLPAEYKERIIEGPPLSASLGPCGPPWALMSWALVGPLGPYGPR